MLDSPKTKLALFCVLAFAGEAILVWWNWHTIAPSSEAMNSLKTVFLSGATFANPAVRSGFTELLVKLLWLNLFTLLDTVANIWVIVLATKRKPEDYPPHQNKVAWLAALWFAFLVVQVPTGIPSALAYWVFIVRPTAKTQKVAYSH